MSNRITYYDEELGSYLLNEHYKGINERDLINYIGVLEDEWVYCCDALPEIECSMTPGLSMPVMVTYLSYYDKTEPITSNHTAAYNFENDKWYWSDGYDIKRCDVEIIAWRELPEPAPVERNK